MLIRWNPTDDILISFLSRRVLLFWFYAVSPGGKWVNDWRVILKIECSISNHEVATYLRSSVWPSQPFVSRFLWAVGTLRFFCFFLNRKWNQNWCGRSHKVGDFMRLRRNCSKEGVTEADARSVLPRCFHLGQTVSGTIKEIWSDWKQRIAAFWGWLSFFGFRS